jgi:histidine ammonia-lyase
MRFLPVLVACAAVACVPPKTPSRPPVPPPVAIYALQEPLPRDALVLGRQLHIEDVVHVARDKQQVTAAPEALERVRRSHELLYTAVDEGHAIYGMNRGVGLNKDKVIFEGGAEAGREASERFNLSVLHAHSAGFGPALPDEVVRAAMLIRAHTMLLGRSGVQEDVVKMLIAMLNLGIVPVVPSGGSVGEADITILPHIGLAMVGEGDVMYEGKHRPAREVLAATGLTPLRLAGKDALAILSSNAYSAGFGVLVAYDVRRTLRASDLVFALSLEGLDGNLAPFLETTQSLRPFHGQSTAASRIRSFLDGSYLESRDPDRALQDPLSFRTVSQVHGAADEALDRLWDLLEVQINASDDNPAIVPDVAGDHDAVAQSLGYTVGKGKGMVLPTANFEPIVWVLAYEELGISLSHVAHSSCQRMIHLGNPELTKLSRFLAPDGSAIALSTIQKTYTSLCTDIRTLSNPVSDDFFSLAGGIEDHATNAPLVVKRVAGIENDLRFILGMELMHGAQAVDLRKRKSPELALGRGSRMVYAAYRNEVPFLDHDRELTPDIQTSYDFVSKRLPLLVEQLAPLTK